MYKKICFIVSCLLFAANVMAVKPGDKIPDCSSSKLHDGQVLNLERYKGKVVYIDFWASWCPPCKTSFPAINYLYNELKDQDVEIVAINVDEEKNDALEFQKNNSADFTIAYDSEGICASDFGVKAMPSSYIIDKNGIVNAVYLGFDADSLNKYRTTIFALLAE